MVKKVWERRSQPFPHKLITGLGDLMLRGTLIIDYLAALICCTKLNKYNAAGRLV
jgi:hypothetical protein